MRLLICTQALDRSDPILGFFYAWTEQFAKDFESITVLCLRAGDHNLPKNVSVYTLGFGRLTRILNTLRYIVVFRNQYDTVFVHMNQEYVLLGGWLWKLLGKRVYLWRNHYAGSILTDFAALFCTKIFCTSKLSYTAKYKKTVLMPVGVDTDVFVPSGERKPGSILSLGRIAPSKRLEILIEALRELQCEADLYGPAEPEYLKGLKDLARGLPVKFPGPIAHDEAAKIFASHDVFVNMSPGGMFDKTIIEAAASGCLILVASPDAAALFGEEAVDSPAAVETRLRKMLALAPEIKERRRRELRSAARAHSLSRLSQRLREIITS